MMQEAVAWPDFRDSCSRSRLISEIDSVYLQYPGDLSKKKKVTRIRPKTVLKISRVYTKFKVRSLLVVRLGSQAFVWVCRSSVGFSGVEFLGEEHWRISWFLISRNSKMLLHTECYEQIYTVEIIWSGWFRLEVAGFSFGVSATVWRRRRSG